MTADGTFFAARRSGSPASLALRISTATVLRDTTTPWPTYTTPELLDLISARRRVLGCGDQAEQIAERIIEVCGDQLDRWQALPTASARQDPTADDLPSLAGAAHRPELTTRPQRPAL
ncbi:hypothetical protein I6A60_02300 [Frankia sp. AgB1.9]|uniref:hypothetical protein n=1 Tax=unclassified Frankia TaxID=2632575 RepID=UPI00193468EA|nr:MULTISPECIES: hypothetical protein [unclassified Frankia]MBL7492561.1 hypothetical protein [Frankia sp. AgW1.1]MBL7546716.1 hypothetical protein [Frankia sp. AgB1.9]MBL7622874.1 hypothetical protein [Frankia sp. AgB1.8]